MLERIFSREIAPSHTKLTTLESLLCILFISIGVTFLAYIFGDGNQIEQLPLVLQRLDPNYLSNDYFVTSFQGMNSRTIYVALLSFLGQYFELWQVFLAMTLLANIATFSITFLMAKHIFDHRAGLLAMMVLVSPAMSLNLGEATFVYSRYLIPMTTATPLALAAVYFGIRQSPILTVIFAIIGSLFHPLVGIETGGIILGVMAIIMMWQWYQKSEQIDSAWLMRYVVALVIFGGAAFLWRQVQSSNVFLSTDEFLAIYGYFRIPHHLVPSEFNTSDYLFFFFMLIGTVGGLVGLSITNAVSREYLRFIILVIGLILLLLPLGYIFVELIPIRLIITLQLFRLLFLFRWLAAIITAGVISYGLAGSVGNWILMGFAMICSLASASAFAAVMLLWVAYEFLDRSHLITMPNLRTWLSIVMMIVAVLGELIMETDFPQELVFFAPIVLIYTLALLDILRAQYLRLIGLTALIVFVIGGPFFAETPGFSIIFDKPILRLSDYDGTGPSNTEMIEFVKSSTPENAVFLAPADWGQFRIFAERSLFVDFKFFPFDDEPMAEWKRRLDDAYGKTEEGGFDAQHDLTEKYEGITDEQLETLVDQYAIDYAILFQVTDTDFPVLFQNDEIKIVTLN